MPEPGAKNACKYWQQHGTCSYGSSCKYRHPTKPCFQLPNCPFGPLKCRYAHHPTTAGAIVAAKGGKGHGGHHPAAACGGGVQSVHAKVVNSDGTFIRAHVSKVSTTLVFAVTLDVSPSMTEAEYGNRLDKALPCLRDIFTNVMRDHDRFALCTFAERVSVLHGPMPRKVVDWRKDLHNIKKSAHAGTAIYNAVVESIDNMRAYDFPDRGRNHKYIVEHLVITDGEDNSSRASLEDAAAAIAKPGLPNYNMVLVSIDVDRRTERKMQRLTAGVRHAHYTPVRDMAGFRAKMGEVSEQLRVKIEEGKGKRVDRVTHFEGTRREAAAALPAAVPGLAQLAPMLGKLSLK
jgi:hypothetical protein